MSACWISVEEGHVNIGSILKSRWVIAQGGL